MKITRHGSKRPSLLAVGHGDSLKQPASEMDRAIEAARRAFN